MGEFDTKALSGQDLDLWIKYGLHYTIVFNSTVTACYDRTVSFSLSKENHRLAKFHLFNKFKEEEKTNVSLKKYLDLNRYSIAIHCKYHNDKETFNKFSEVIDPESLNAKQRFLLNLPNFTLIALKKFHLLLIKKGIYLTAFR